MLLVQNDINYTEMELMDANDATSQELPVHYTTLNSVEQDKVS